MAASVLPIYQQRNNGNDFVATIHLMLRRTLRIREKYVILIVFTMFVFVCFGGIFFLPDLRDRGLTSDGYIGPDIFIPKRDTSTNSSVLKIPRHGAEHVRDPHEEQDINKLRDKINASFNNNKSISVDDTNVERMKHLKEIEDDKQKFVDEKKAEFTSKLSSHELNANGTDDELTRKRQAKIKEVQ